MKSSKTVCFFGVNQVDIIWGRYKVILFLTSGSNEDWVEVISSVRSILLLKRVFRENKKSSLTLDKYLKLNRISAHIKINTLTFV